MKAVQPAEFTTQTIGRARAGLARESTQTAQVPTFASLVSTGQEKSMQAKLEAVVADLLVSALLPKQMDRFYGAGIAGDIARQMLGQQIADSIARGGGLGIGARMTSASNTTSTKAEES